MLFKLAKIALNWSYCLEFFFERNILIFFRIHTLCSLRWVWNPRSFNELKAFHSIEAISKIVINLFWIVTIGKNIKKSLVRNEVESCKDLFLLLEIFIQGFLTHLNLFVEVVKSFFSSFPETSSDDTWIFSSLIHHLSEGNISGFESSRIIWKLSFNILRIHEDWLKSHPVSLYFVPNLDDRVNSLKVLLPVNNFVFELFNIFG